MKTIFLRIWVVVSLLGTGSSALSQVYYVSAAGSDSQNNGKSKDTPFQTVYKALKQTDVTEIRVSSGTYKISAKGAGEGELDIPSGVTLRGGYALVGGHMEDFQTDHPEQTENQTILQGDSSCRIATVAGVLENVTVTGGMAVGDNGGGVYVKTDGIVRNCVIHSNQATGVTVKVGDLFMEGPSGNYFMSPNKFAESLKDQVVGVVFWINPVKNAPPGEQGKVVGFSTFKNKWSNSGATCEPYLTELEAMEDMDGEGNTNRILSQSGTFLLAEQCRGYRGEGIWYMPAAGEYMLMLIEWSAVDEAFEIVWNKLNRTDRKTVFGVDNTALWADSGMAYWRGGSALASSSSCSSTTVWMLGSSFQNATDLYSARQANLSATPRTYPVRKF